uniref:Putative secreted protein n=1 Tax=Ixodes ricinus TaxID=34613 RepID=A0A6B0U3R7_IXORI
MTAFQIMMLLSVGAPLTPAGGSSCNLLKSRMSLRLAGVDILKFLIKLLFKGQNCLASRYVPRKKPCYSTEQLRRS